MKKILAVVLTMMSVTSALAANPRAVAVPSTNEDGIAEVREARANNWDRERDRDRDHDRDGNPHGTTDLLRRDHVSTPVG